MHLQVLNPSSKQRVVYRSSSKPEMKPKLKPHEPRRSPDTTRSSHMGRWVCRRFRCLWVEGMKLPEHGLLLRSVTGIRSIEYGLPDAMENNLLFPTLCVGLLDFQQHSLECPTPEYPQTGSARQCPTPEDPQKITGVPSPKGLGFRV